MTQLGNKVTIEELADLLMEPQDSKAICTSKKINPWSERKPIRFSKTSPLEVAEFRGMTTDIADGICYGLKCGVKHANADALHAADWSYIGRPQGGIPSSPYRIDDFWGYEKDLRYPTLSGSGLVDGLEVIYTNNESIGTRLQWNLNVPGIVDVAKAYSGGNVDYSNMYLCCLVGNHARAMINQDAVAGGGVYPMLYNDIECASFTFPNLEGIFNSNYLPEERNVTLFIVNGNDIAQFRDAWVDMTTAIALTYEPITLPFQVNVRIKFKNGGRIYITALSLSIREYRGAEYITTAYVKGPDWDDAYEYRVLYNVASSGGALGSYDVAVEKDGMESYVEPSVDEILIGAGFRKDITTYNYTVQADFQVRPMSDDSWTTTGYIKTISVIW